MAERGALLAAQRLRATGKSIQRFLQITAVSYISHLSRQTRPSIAPQPAINIKPIRENPSLYSENCVLRNYEALSKHPYTIAELFDEWKDSQHQARKLRERSNQVNLQLGAGVFGGGKGDDDGGDGTAASVAATQEGDQEQQEVIQAQEEHERQGQEQQEAAKPQTQTTKEQREDLLVEAKRIKGQLDVVSQHERSLRVEYEALALELPNLTSSDTPLGQAPRVLEHFNAPASPELLAEGISHGLIGPRLDVLDLRAASGTSGWGFYFLKNEGALLEQALVQYALSIAMARGFKVVAPPSMVYSHVSALCGFQPRDKGGESQVYAIAREDAAREKPEMCLAGTAEIPFAGMMANADLDSGDLPIMYLGSCGCFRAVAGGRGVDTKGLYRVHEFTKVEMFGWTKPDDSVVDLFEEMVEVQKQILGSLGLYCRVLEQPSYDLGASAVRKQDIEAFFPSRKARDGGWGEVTSTSICTDYQTRRLRTTILGLTKHNRFPFTANGTALAVPRVVAAILENNWNKKDSSVKIPEVLWPWMHGVKVIQRKT